MGKFPNVVAEAAYAICGHGFAESEAGSVEFRGWFARVTTSAVLLLNIGETDLAERYRNAYRDLSHDVIICEDSLGFVTLVDSGPLGFHTVDAKWSDVSEFADPPEDDPENVN